MIREDSKAILQKLTVKENAVLEIMFKGEVSFFPKIFTNNFYFSFYCLVWIWVGSDQGVFFSSESRNPEIWPFPVARRTGYLWRWWSVTDGWLRSKYDCIFPLPTTHRDQMNSTSGWSFYLVGKLLARCIMDSRQIIMVKTIAQNGLISCILFI
jgi:hypothetical protein